MHKHIHCRDTFDVDGVNGVLRFCYALIKRLLKPQITQSTSDNSSVIASKRSNLRYGRVSRGPHKILSRPIPSK
jgi:hypothetical protein